MSITMQKNNVPATTATTAKTTKLSVNERSLAQKMALRIPKMPIDNTAALAEQAEKLVREILMTTNEADRLRRYRVALVDTAKAERTFANVRNAREVNALKIADMLGNLDAMNDYGNYLYESAMITKDKTVKEINDDLLPKIEELDKKTKKLKKLLTDIERKLAIRATATMNAGRLPSKEEDFEKDIPSESIYQNPMDVSMFQKNLSDDAWNNIVVLKPTNELDAVTAIKLVRKVLKDGIPVMIKGERKRVYLYAVSGNGRKQMALICGPKEFKAEFLDMGVKALHLDIVKDGKTRMSFAKIDAANAYAFTVGREIDHELKDKNVFVANLKRPIYRAVRSFDMKTGEYKIKIRLKNEDEFDAQSLSFGELAKAMIDSSAVRYYAFKSFVGKMNCRFIEWLCAVLTKKDIEDIKKHGLMDAWNRIWTWEELQHVELLTTTSSIKCWKLVKDNPDAYWNATKKWHGHMIAMHEGMEYRNGYAAAQAMNQFSVFSDEHVEKLCKDAIQRLNDAEKHPEMYGGRNSDILALDPTAIEIFRKDVAHDIWYEIARAKTGVVAEHSCTRKIMGDPVSMVSMIPLGNGEHMPLRTMLDVDCVYTNGVYGNVTAFRNPTTGHDAFPTKAYTEEELRLTKWAINVLPKNVIFWGVIEEKDGKLWGRQSKLYLQDDFDGDGESLSTNEVIYELAKLNKSEYPNEMEDLPTVEETATVDSYVLSIVNGWKMSNIGSPANCFFVLMDHRKEIESGVFANPVAQEAYDSLMRKYDWLTFTDMVNYMEVLTWLLVDLGKHGGVQYAEIFHDIMGFLQTVDEDGESVFKLPMWKRYESKALKRAESEENKDWADAVLPKVNCPALNHKYDKIAGDSINNAVGKKIHEEVHRQFAITAEMTKGLWSIQNWLANNNWMEYSPMVTVNGNNVNILQYWKMIADTYKEEKALHERHLEAVFHELDTEDTYKLYQQKKADRLALCDTLKYQLIELTGNDLMVVYNWCLVAAAGRCYRGEWTTARYKNGNLCQSTLWVFCDIFHDEIIEVLKSKHPEIEDIEEWLEKVRTSNEEFAKEYLGM